MSHGDETWAERQLILRQGSDPPRPITIRVGRPRPLAEGGAACAVAIDVIAPDPRDVVGEDGVQALVLALELLRRILEPYAARGELSWPDGTPYEDV
jgi:hypothetical protein